MVKVCSNKSCGVEVYNGGMFSSGNLNVCDECGKYVCDNCVKDDGKNKYCPACYKN